MLTSLGLHPRPGPLAAPDRYLALARRTSPPGHCMHRCLHCRSGSDLALRATGPERLGRGRVVIYEIELVLRCALISARAADSAACNESCSPDVHSWPHEQIAVLDHFAPGRVHVWRPSSSCCLAVMTSVRSATSRSGFVWVRGVPCSVIRSGQVVVEAGLRARRHTTAFFLELQH